jgi:hypothetical protein
MLRVAERGIAFRPLVAVASTTSDHAAGRGTILTGSATAGYGEVTIFRCGSAIHEPVTLREALGLIGMLLGFVTGAALGARFLGGYPGLIAGALVGVLVPYLCAWVFFVGPRSGVR